MVSSESGSEVAQACLDSCDPVDCSPPGSSVLGIFWAKALEWLPFPSSEVVSTSALHSPVGIFPITLIG